MLSSNHGEGGDGGAGGGFDDCMGGLRGALGGGGGERDDSALFEEGESCVVGESHDGVESSQCWW